MLALHASPFRTHLQTVLHSARQDLLVASPFIKTREAEWVCAQIAANGRANSLRLRVLTDIRSTNVLAGSLDMAALRLFQSRIAKCEVVNLPRLHAKVYIADEDSALVTSANLTPSGLDANLEYGVSFTNPSAIRQVRQDMDRYAAMGNALNSERISELTVVADELKAEYDEVQRSQERTIRRRFDAKLKAANIEFIRAQIGNRSAHGLFADSMVYLLATRPMSTKELHSRLKELLPELCDDTTELVIDGRTFGKKWKHVVRNAQAFLRRAGRIKLKDGRWMLTEATK
jgi:phosphatidylserine/phosphatidylglycerophosphate/cardiolipin synthase-like enzyme